VAAQRLEERLKATRDEATHDWTVPLDAADARRPLDPRHWWWADKADLDPLDRKLL
jgi:hypothetical protein